jgi:hypothetical protein
MFYDAFRGKTLSAALIGVFRIRLLSKPARSMVNMQRRFISYSSADYRWLKACHQYGKITSLVFSGQIAKTERAGLLQLFVKNFLRVSLNLRIHNG